MSGILGFEVPEDWTGTPSEYIVAIFRAVTMMERGHMTRAEFDSLSPSLQGSLWPRCKTCHHIAQSHDTIITEEAREGSCCEYGLGQCPTCGNHGDKIPCQCMGYDGPASIEELLAHNVK